MLFDSQNPVIELSSGERRLQLLADTGAFASAFYPSFRSALSPGQILTMKRVRQKVTGVGGTIVDLRIDQLPELPIDVLGRRLDIRKANFTPADDGKQYWDGWMGIDVIRNGFLGSLF